MTTHKLLQEVREVVALAHEYKRLTKQCEQYRGSVSQMVLKRSEADSCLQSLLSKIDSLSSSNSTYPDRPALGL